MISEEEKDNKRNAEIKFIKDLIMVVVFSILAFFCFCTILFGNFLENSFFRKSLLFFVSNEIVTEDKVTNGSFIFAIMTCVSLLVLNDLGDKSKSQVLKQLLDSRRSIQIYILIAFIAFGTTFWQGSVMILGAFILFLIIALISISFKKLKKYLKNTKY